MELRKFPPTFKAAEIIPAAFIPAETRRNYRTPRVSELRWILLLTLSIFCASMLASASSNGISGFSGKNGSTCTSCHSSGSAPTVTMTGPTSVASGSTSTYTISVSTGSSGNGGVDVAASAGTFAAGTGTKVLNGEIVHSAPSTTHSWTFSWTAPTVTATTTATLYAAAIDSFGGGTGTRQQVITVTAAAPAPTISVSPASVSFNYQVGGTSPASQSVAVSSSGSALNYTVTTSATWLSATASGTTPGSVSVSVNPQALSAGTYTGTVTVTSPGATGSPKSVAITLTVTPAPQLPTLIVNPANLTYAYQIGGSTPASQAVALTSSGSAANYTTATNATWLSVSPASGTTPGNLSISVNPSGLAAGTYTGNVTITSAGASNSPKTVPVTFTVTAATPTLSVSPASLTFAYQIGGSTPNAQAVALTSSGSATSYTTATNATWLSVAPASGSTPGNLSVSVNPSGLAAGTYTGNVTITSGGASNSPKTVPVTFTVTTASTPSLTVSPLSVSFSFQTGGATPAAQTVNLSSTSTLSYTASASPGWLSVSPGSGSTPGSLSVSVNPSGLAAGTYTGTVTVTASGASNSPQKIAVNLAVTGTPPSNPSLNITPGNLSFTYASGSTTSGTQNLSVASSGSVLSITATASGGGWLTVTPGTGSTPAMLKVSANPTGMAAGTYNGTITITSAGAANTPQTVPVSLVVSGASSGRLRVWPSRAISFEYESGHSDPAPRTVRVYSTGTHLSFTAAAHGGTWVSVTPSGGTTPGTLSISVDPTGLASGTYTANVNIAASGSTGVNVPVILRVASDNDDGGGDGGSDDGSATVTRFRAWPYAYDPASTNTVAATWMDGTGASSVAAAADTRNQGLLLSKTSHASNQAQAGVVIRDVEGISLTQLGYDLRSGGQCTATSPRFVVVTSDDVVHKTGCATGIAQPAPAAGWKRLRFDPANPAQTSPAIASGSKVKSIHLVLDGGPETGSSMVVLDNININGKSIGRQ